MCLLRVSESKDQTETAGSVIVGSSAIRKLVSSRGNHQYLHHHQHHHHLHQPNHLNREDLLNHFHHQNKDQVIIGSSGYFNFNGSGTSFQEIIIALSDKVGGGKKVFVVVNPSSTIWKMTKHQENNEDDDHRGENSSCDDYDECDDGSEEVSSTKSSLCSASIMTSSSSSSFFEGVEKLLEVWFANSDGDSEKGDLRRIPRDKLEVMLRKVKCCIISETKNSKVDAYILSESSMFISKRRFILKTCGTTTTLKCINTLLQLAKAFAGFDVIEDIFYSRKNFARPELQLEPHHSFEREVAILDDMFSDGAAYCMGTMNRDCWYLYALNPLDKYVSGRVDTEPDQTIEILMQDLDQEVMAKFCKDNAIDGKDATFKAGINRILPNMKVDDFLFDPCGYSMNGILNNESADNGLGEYMTIHITPEPTFSYVSFESNIPLTSYLDVIQRVLETFQPGKFVLTIFANRTSMAAQSHKELQKSRNFGHWIRKDIQYSQFQNYELTFAHFVRFPS